MAKKLDLIDFITSQTTPEKFDAGGSVVQKFDVGGGPLDTIDVMDVLEKRGVQAAELAQAQANAQNALLYSDYGGWLPEAGGGWDLVPEPGTMGNPQSMWVMENIIMEALEGMKSKTDWDSDKVSAFQTRIDDDLLQAAADNPDDEELQTIAAHINAGGTTALNMTQAAEAANAVVDSVGKVLSTEVPGVTDLPVIGDIVDWTSNTIADAVETVLGWIIPDGWDTTIVIGPDGTELKVEPPGTASTGTKSTTKTGESNSGDTKVVVTTGTPGADVLIDGGTIGEAVGEGVNAETG